MRRLFFAFLVFALTGGCSIRPLPQDVAGAKYDTWDIVRRIRCEMREAIITYIDRALVARNLGHIPPFGQRRPGLFKEMYDQRDKLGPDMKKVIERYDGALITYDFTFDITENNNLLATANVGKAITRGTFGISLTGENNRERHNTRTFRISDNFIKLVVEKDEQDFCVKWDIRKQDVYAANYIYPITGNLNLAEMTGTFLDLNQSGNLTGKDNTPPALSDNIQFVTRFSGSINPAFEISPLGSNFEVARAGITATGIREDKHSVIIVLTLPPENTSKAVARNSQIEIAEEHIARQRVIKQNSDLGDIARELRGVGR
ncbi:hypothetical protein [Bradyrhizobium archetypum]|uniref:Lipoprotein n=1 Tax=Bradyrhizobium archetypum TaxID=2721160 RepID=A0A7Y4H260_9BRAD|nr:hypothetical protein [Bradyrhizobium archetypum]NOJ46043.1 hypothetical protein [Bradyrhizobium archetypum]